MTSPANQQLGRNLVRVATAALLGTPLHPEWSGDEASAVAFIAGFTDNLGHRRSIDAPVLAAMLGTKPPASPASRRTVDEHLWWSLHDESASPLQYIDDQSGSLTKREPDQPIEVWTEVELAALHALSHHLARTRSDEERTRIAARLRSAAEWHTAELQPDNATNHPWAVHVFATLGATNPHAALHAQTLIHNATVATGRPDRFSAVLLLDAGRQLTRQA